MSIPDIITTWFKNFFFPNPDHFTDAVQQVKQAGITKLGIDSNSWGLNVGSRIPEGLSASLYLGILDTNDYVLFDPKFLIDGVNTFRYVIQAFIGFHVPVLLQQHRFYDGWSPYFHHRSYHY